MTARSVQLLYDTGIQGACYARARRAFRGARNRTSTRTSESSSRVINKVQGIRTCENSAPGPTLLIYLLADWISGRIPYSVGKYSTKEFDQFCYKWLVLVNGNGSLCAHNLLWESVIYMYVLHTIRIDTHTDRISI